eukprot:3261984-Rhodomonas_salina.1
MCCTLPIKASGSSHPLLRDTSALCHPHLCTSKTTEGHLVRVRFADQSDLLTPPCPQWTAGNLDQPLELRQQ